MVAPLCYDRRHEIRKACAKPRRCRALPRRDGAPRTGDQDCRAAWPDWQGHDLAKGPQASAEAARYPSSSSIKLNRICRGASGAGGKSRTFSPLERDFVFGFFSPTSPPIRQALADDTLSGLLHALIIIDAQRNPLVVAEIKFCQVAV